MYIYQTASSDAFRCIVAATPLDCKHSMTICLTDILVLHEPSVSSMIPYKL